MSETMRIEVYGTCLFDASAAEEGGADALHLGGKVEGGSTPSLGLVRMVRKAIALDLNVVIRPPGERGMGPQDARCTAREIEAMRHDIRRCREEGVNGVILGVRDEAGGVDAEAMQALLHEAGDLQTTLDHVFDGELASLEQARELGLDRVYWKGLRWEGRIMLPEEVARREDQGRELIEAGGDRVAVLAEVNSPLEALAGPLERVPVPAIFVDQLVLDDHPFEGNRTVDPRKVRMLRDLVDQIRK